MDTQEAKDKVLKAIEDILREIVRVEGLQKASITLWRWEQPDIELRWLDNLDDKEYIWKSIHSFIQNDDVPFDVHTDVNAWQDIDLDAGKHRMRKWGSKGLGNVTVENLNVNEIKSNLKETIRKAYDHVKDWTANNLKENPATIKSL